MVRASRGFTLIELMVVVAIVALLAMVALPSYQKQVIKGNRAAAQAEMMDIANRQQQLFLANRAYASKTELEATGYSLPAAVAKNYSYDIDVGTGDVPTFTVEFTPIGSQASDGPDPLTLTSAGAKGPAGKW